MSSSVAKAYHSLKFSDYDGTNAKNTWDDWHLIPASRPVVVPPPVVTKYIDIPGMHGSLDMSNYLTDLPTYGMREGSWEFYVHHDYSHWANIYSEIMDYLHGLNKRVILADDPEYFYTGRIHVNEFKSDPNWSTITLNYKLNPFKKDLYETDDDNWLWDPFSFVDGVIRKYKQLSVEYGTPLELTIPNGAEKVYPIIKVQRTAGSGSIGITLNGDSLGTYSSDTETTFTSTKPLIRGSNTFVATASSSGTKGVVTVKYRGGWL